MSPDGDKVNLYRDEVGDEVRQLHPGEEKVGGNTRCPHLTATMPATSATTICTEARRVAKSTRTIRDIGTAATITSLVSLLVIESGTMKLLSDFRHVTTVEEPISDLERESSDFFVVVLFIMVVEIRATVPTGIHLSEDVIGASKVVVGHGKHTLVVIKGIIGQATNLSTEESETLHLAVVESDTSTATDAVVVGSILDIAIETGVEGIDTTVMRDITRVAVVMMLTELAFTLMLLLATFVTLLVGHLHIWR